MTVRQPHPHALNSGADSVVPAVSRRPAITGRASQFRPADALNLPFLARDFDLVACQFGAMFFPDRIRANVEALRVLRGNGHYLLVTFDALERNPIPKAAEDAVNALFPDAPIRYMKSGPFCYAETKQIEMDLLAAGFTAVEIETVTLSSPVNAEDAATGLVFGSPLSSEITSRDASALQRAAEVVADALQPWDGKNAPMSVHIAIARKCS